MNLNQSIVEDAALGWFGELSYAVGRGWCAWREVSGEYFCIAFHFKLRRENAR